MLMPFSAFSADQIMAAKFSGLEKGQTAVIQRYFRGSKYWSFDPKSMLVGDSDHFFKKSDFYPQFSCVKKTLGTLFQQLQLNSMNKYAMTNYLSMPEIEHYLGESLKIADRPISFYQYLSHEASPEGMNGFLNPAEARSSLKFAAYSNTRSNVRVEDLHVRASLYSVSGQTMNVDVTWFGVKPESVPLPWMLDSDFKHLLGKEFTREKYPLIFELGRASSTGPEQHKALSALAGKDMLQEALQFSGFNDKGIDLATASFHCLSKENIQKLVEKFPRANILRSSRDPENNAVLLVSLRDYLGVHNPKLILESWQHFDAAIGRETAPEKMMAFFGQIKRHSGVFLDNQFRGKLESIPLHVSSAGLQRPFAPAGMLGELYGFKSAEVGRLMDQRVSLGVHSTLDQIGFVETPLMPHIVKDPSFGPYQIILDEHHAMKISNLDPAKGKDPEYVLSSIVAGFEHSARATLRGVPNGDKMLGQYVQAMYRDKAMVAVTTQFPETAATLRRLAPAHAYTLDLKNDGGANTWWDYTEKLSEGKIKRPSEKLEVFIFDMKQISQFQHMARARAPRDQVQWPQANPGYHAWQTEIIDP